VDGYPPEFQGGTDSRRSAAPGATRLGSGQWDVPTALAAWWDRMITVARLAELHERAWICRLAGAAFRHLTPLSGIIQNRANGRARSSNPEAARSGKLIVDNDAFSDDALLCSRLMTVRRAVGAVGNNTRQRRQVSGSNLQQPAIHARSHAAREHAADRITSPTKPQCVGTSTGQQPAALAPGRRQILRASRSAWNLAG